MLRITLGLFLGLSVSLTGLAVASTRGLDQSLGQVELCTGSGPVIVYLDEDGQPAAPPHYCPEFALNLLAALDVPTITTEAVSARLIPVVIPVVLSLTGRDVIRASARGPPQPV
ncbi:hypothetical protein [Primorskyibacter sp. S87]|uniref:hypothetical protein n=1 Tax=Primorskyibacter sp. S87 TaxID=3415126 RepID=UPI003C7E9855